LKERGALSGDTGVGSFNRTILELKGEKDFSVIFSKRTFNRTILELKGLMPASFLPTRHPFNRTILELKVEILFATFMLSMPSIAPYWN